MPVIDPTRLRRIQRASRELRTLFIVLFVLSVLGTAITLTHPRAQAAKVVLAGIVFQGASLTGKLHVLSLAQHVLGTVIYLVAFYHLIRLLGLYAQGRLFTTQNVVHIRRLGLSFMCFALVWLVGLIGAAPQIAAAQDQWSRILPSFPFSSLINGGVILFAGWIMNEGRELREEQDLVI